MSRNLKVSAALLGIFAALAVALVLHRVGDSGKSAGPTTAASTQPPETTTTSNTGSARVVRRNTRRLGAPGQSGVTFTEFLDFECEACGAAFPAIEQLRREYAGRVTFAIRYFPLPSHKNSETAAIAVEAAARQGRLLAMYQRMYETQASWGEQTTSKAGTFRTLAKDLGLNMQAFDAAVKDPATRARVRADVAEGIALGVDATPTFFVDEKRIVPQSMADLRNTLDAAMRAR